MKYLNREEERLRWYAKQASEKKKKRTLDLWRTLDQPLLIIIRGLPGAGKSTLARAIEKFFGPRSILCSEDDAHWDASKGRHVFDKRKHKQSKIECKMKVERCIDETYPIIVVDNCHATHWSYMSHIKRALEAG